jgi:hypothetical protein
MMEKREEFNERLADFLPQAKFWREAAWGQEFADD